MLVQIKDFSAKEEQESFNIYEIIPTFYNKEFSKEIQNNLRQHKIIQLQNTLKLINLTKN